MKSDINYLTLSDHISTFNKGITPKYSEAPTNTIVLNQKCIRDGKIDYSLSQFVSTEQKFSDQKVVKEGDVLINSTGQGTAGRSAYVSKLPLETVVVDSHILIVRLQNKKWAKILAYCLLIKEDLLLTLLTGSSGQGELNNDIVFNNLYFPFSVDFDLDFTTHLLKVIDEKIALNSKINDELEQMAQLTYDYWFKQFDFPDEDGNPYKSSGGKMIYNEQLKREIPESWDVLSLYEMATFTNGIAAQKYYANDGEPSLPIIKIREISNGISSNTEFATRNVPPKVLINNGDVLFSWSATLEVKLWSGGDGVLNQHIFKVTSDTFPKSIYYFQLLDYLQHFKMMAENRKTTMGHITKDHLIQAKIVAPKDDIAQNFHGLIAPILDKFVKLDEESQILGELRDWLLPMLMTGQVKVAK